jgi:glutathione S-transferase
MEPVAFITVIALLQVMGFQGRVARARNEFNVPGPATSGHPVWERYNRVHLNTVENLVVFVPLVWVCGFFLNAWVAAVLGALFVVARAVYSRAYVSEPTKRAVGSWLTFIALVLLALGSLAGIGLRVYENS